MACSENCSRIRKKVGFQKKCHFPNVFSLACTDYLPEITKIGAKIGARLVICKSSPSHCWGYRVISRKQTSNVMLWMLKSRPETYLPCPWKRSGHIGRGILPLRACASL